MLHFCDKTNNAKLGKITWSQLILGQQTWINLNADQPRTDYDYHRSLEQDYSHEGLSFLRDIDYEDLTEFITLWGASHLDGGFPISK